MLYQIIVVVNNCVSETEWVEVYTYVYSPPPYKVDC